MSVPPPQKPKYPAILIPNIPLRPPVFHIVVFHVLQAGEEAAAGCGALHSWLSVTDWDLDLHRGVV